MTTYNDIKSQAQFVVELSLRLQKSIERDGIPAFGPGDVWVKKHTQKQADIKRIRRELLKLYLMLNPWERSRE